MMSEGMLVKRVHACGCVDGLVDRYESVYRRKV